jgi:nucleoside-diphosphate-sugar epimerase
MNRVLVTGSGGFLGRRVVAQLLGRGWEVHGVHLHSTPPPGVISHRVDLLDPIQTKQLISQVRPMHLVHLAWYAEHGKFWDSPLNVEWEKASEVLFESFVAGGGRRAVFAGTCAEYDWSYSHLSEEKTPSKPRTLYGSCKNSLRVKVEDAGKKAGVEVAWGRIVFMYGVGEDQRRFVPSIMSPLRNGERAVVKFGSHVRDFMHIEDVAGAFVSILESELTGIVNVASGEAKSLGEIGRIIAELTHEESLLDVQDSPATQENPAVLAADVGKLRSIGFRPKFNLREGLKTLIT